MKCRGGLWSASRNQRAADDNNHKLGLCLFFISFLCLHHFISLFPSFSFIIPDTSFHHSSSLHFLFFSAPSGTFSPFLSPSHRFSASSLSSSPRGLFSCLTLYLCLYSVFHFFFFFKEWCDILGNPIFAVFKRRYHPHVCALKIKPQPENG